MTMKTRRENYIPRLVDKLTTTKLKIPTGRRRTSSLITTEHDRGVELGPMVKNLQIVVRTGLGNLDLRMYQTYSEPLSSALATVDKVKCPNGHYLADDGPPTLAYLSDDGGPVFRNGCSTYTSSHCTIRDRRWQFKTVRLYCSLCGVCYCEPCMLKAITEGAVFTPFQ